MTIILIGILSVLLCIIAFFYVCLEKHNYQKRNKQQSESFKEKHASEEKHAVFAYLLLRQKAHFDQYIEIKIVRKLCLTLLALFSISYISFICFIDKNTISVIEPQLMILLSIIMIIIFIYVLPARKQSQHQLFLKETDIIINNILQEELQLSEIPDKIKQIEATLLQYWL